MKDSDGWCLVNDITRGVSFEGHFEYHFPPSLARKVFLLTILDIESYSPVLEVKESKRLYVMFCVYSIPFYCIPLDHAFVFIVIYNNIEVAKLHSY